MSRVLIVLDCNVYLDVARLAGAPYASERFHDLAVQFSPALVPHPTVTGADSLKLVAACQSGRVDARRQLEVWSTTHVRNTVRYKAAQSATPDPKSGHRGLGWSSADAEGLVDDLMDWIVERSGGEHLETFVGAVDNPPLDHEDGTVYAACRYIEGQNPLDQVYCVTRDKGFLCAYQRGELSGHVEVVSPSAMLSWILAQRRGVMPRPRRHG